MTANDVSKALGSMDERYVAEAITYAAGRRAKRYLKWGAIAACFCLVVGIAFRAAVGFFPSQMTDVYREGTLMEITDESELPAQYEGTILAFRLDCEKYELYYKYGGAAENTKDWYTLLSLKYSEEGRIVLHCMFGDTTVEDWKVDSVFTHQTTQTVCVNGVEVQIARNEPSLQYAYWHYAIFEYDGVVYDVRVQSDDAAYVYAVLNALLMAE